MRVRANYYGRISAEVGVERDDDKLIVFDPTGKGEDLIEITPWLMRELLIRFRQTMNWLEPPKKAKR